MAGISDPGLMASGFLIHRRRFSGVFATAPAASVSRLIRWVKSGPKRPFATVPPTAWQLMHAVVSKTLRPSATVGSAPAGRDCAWIHWSNCWRDSTYTRNSILACCVPQYCAHCPRYNPVFCGSIHMWLTLLGIRSVLPFKRGTQKLWSVSAESSVRKVGVGFLG